MTDFQTSRDERREERREERRRRREMWMERNHNNGGNGHVWMGGLLLVIGGVALMRSLGLPMPVWLFSWQMLLITIGLFIGLRKGFRDGGWFIPVLVGGAFLANQYFLSGQMHKHIWPLLLIVVGIVFILRAGQKPKRRWHSDMKDDWDEKKNTGVEATTTTTTIPPINPASSDTRVGGEDDFISITSIFGGTEKTILSKNFRGGSMVNIFGGSELSFAQSDLNGTAILDVTCIFGGATLIVPSNWVVRSDAVTIFGGIGDKRKNMSNYNEPNNSKALIIKGTIMFGGLEIKSF